jgi:hypothetical protein
MSHHDDPPMDELSKPSQAELDKARKKMGYLTDDQKTICRLIRQLRLMALKHGSAPDASTLYDAAEWLQRLAGLTREQTEQR